MKDIPSESICDCPVECNFISYSYTLTSIPFDPEESCPPSYSFSGEDLLMKPFYEMKYPPLFVRSLKKIKHNISEDDAEYCKRNLPYRAEITFRLATDLMPVTIISRRMSFFDKMSAFGIIHCIVIVSYCNMIAL